ncbi:nitrate reductase subunit beta [Desulforhopalus sp. IMCC35007]|uniref:nitrate reductase subunit beta n=1 Tax=Desulforhopalus sp. IMCC35007 TaxID=2569543 RepID=UPI0010AE9CB4|nr:nitrate reductase subunit beta [Desulforhopalus sp. IMCC35007]TKB05628.1 nitrate reductase subunit beta [Desulforhopalus sp. IMCC35007]
MKIKVQMSMVLNLDKCIGCHTCSIPCKNVWTTRKGAEYMWFNNVETKPSIGYPKEWENQSLHKGGWVMDKGELRLKGGGRLHKASRIFHNPDLPVIDDYYEPWDYDYESLITSPRKKHQPSIRPKSQLTGEPMQIKWGPNWEDDLAGVCETGARDVNFSGLDHAIYLSFKQAFMFYLPRLCEHCLNPACVASCPSGAMYKRDEDGIVLVDQERCRGWRYCVSGCPYKKVYFNWKSGRSEKCIFCYPRLEAGLTTLCAHSCVGRIRYVGVVLYDADRIHEAASAKTDREVYPAHLDLFLDPKDPETIAAARSQGIPEHVMAAARRSPIYPLAKTWHLALPLHPEFRTLPMVWYIPPLSPVESLAKDEDIRTAVDNLRIPVKYLANLLTAGDEQPVRMALKRLAAVRAYMRSVRVENKPDETIGSSVGLDSETLTKMYELLAIAKLEDRNVIPTASHPDKSPLHNTKGCAGFPDYR